MRRLVIAACAVVAALPACSRPRATPWPIAVLAAEDSVRAIVERAGSEPLAQAIARTAGGASCVLRTASPMSFDALAGLEVTLWGRRAAPEPAKMPGTACLLDVSRYAVRAVDGIAAVDGVLRADGASYALETADGARRPLREVPTALRAQVGARIFWAGPLDRAPAAYGVLVAAPR